MRTSVVSGSATAVIIRSGEQTMYGRISRAFVTRGSEIEFQRGIRRFGYMIMEVTFLLVLFSSS